MNIHDLLDYDKMSSYALTDFDPNTLPFRTGIIKNMTKGKEDSQPFRVYATLIRKYSFDNCFDSFDKSFNADRNFDYILKASTATPLNTTLYKAKGDAVWGDKLYIKKKVCRQFQNIYTYFNEESKENFIKSLARDFKKLWNCANVIDFFIVPEDFFDTDDSVFEQLWKKYNDEYNASCKRKYKDYDDDSDKISLEEWLKPKHADFIKVMTKICEKAL